MASETEIAGLLVRLSADIEQYNREFERATRTAERQTRDIDRHISRAGKAFKGMGAEVARMALGFVGFGGAVATATTILSKMVSEAAGAELANKRFAAQLNATGNASGKTVTQLNALADRLKSTTLATEDGAKAAISQLLSFRTVAGDVFDETLTLAQDLSAAGFGGLAENAAKLGKALEDPEKGFKALRSANIILTDAQENAIKSMEKMGDRLGAQRALLDAVRDRVGGAGSAERDTLTGAWHGLTEATADWFETLGKNSGLVSTFTGLLNKMASSMAEAAEKMGTKKGELSHLEDFAKRFNGNVDPRTKARIDQLKEEIALEDQVEAIRARSAKNLSALAQIQIESDENLNKKRSEFSAQEKERRAALADFNAKADEQEHASHVKALEEKARASRVFNDEMIELRLELEDRLNTAIPEPPPIVIPHDVDEGIDRYEEAVAEMKAIDDEARRDMFDAWRDGWADLLDGNIKSFEQFADRLKSIGVQWAANHLAKESGKWANDALTAGFGEEGAARIKSAVKTVAAIASLATSFFGPRPSDRTEGVTRALFTGQRWETDLGPNKDSPENRAVANALDDAVFKFIGSLEAFGLKTGASSYMIEAGSGNSLAPFRASVSGGAIQSFQTQNEAFKWIAEQLVDSISEVPARLQEAVDNFDGSKVEEFFNEIEKFAAMDKVLSDIDDEILKALDPKAYDLKKLDDYFKPIRDEAERLGFDLTNIDRLWGMERARINAQYAQQMADDAARAAEEAARATAEAARIAEEALAKMKAKADEAWNRVNQRARDNLNARLEELSTERAAIEENKNAAESFLNSIRNARQRFTTDSRLFRGSPQERLTTLLAKLDATAAAAANGDRTAQAELAEIAMAAADANLEFNASSEEGVRIQTHIMGILEDAEDYADVQLKIAEDNLKANQDSVTLQQQMLAALENMGPDARMPSVKDDFAAINQSFATTKANFMANGGTDAQFVNSAAYKAFEQELFAMIGSTKDVGYLLADLSNAQSQATGNDPYAASSGRRVGVVRERLRALGVAGFSQGGMTGNLAEVHSGELIYTGPPARVFNARETNGLMNGGALTGLQEDINMLARTVSVGFQDQLGALKALAGQVGRMNGNLEMVLARA